MRIKLPLMYYY